ncbi:transcriptional regulator, GntR family [Actinopolyspora xinjiangensis]|uniref:Transcriptional regulator, GntR family n=2 Tax=Actinopolyspora xinjiangensis TaxID=405564 RepID=A0A1H0X0X9_9ACTN|nr:transcriptional regulator, GntR family [Actinopolyspora xinjiangensis]
MSCYAGDMSQRDWRPRYIQVAEELREQIHEGRLSPGEPLHSEPEIAETYGLSRTSVRNAIKLLRNWGLVTVQKGKGTYVRQPPQRVKRDADSRYQWEKDRVVNPEEDRAREGATEADTGLPFERLSFHIAYDTTQADDDLATVFGIAPDTKLLRRIYETRDTADGTSFRSATSYLVYDTVSANPALLDEANEPWPGGTQHQLSTLGIEIDRITDEVTARLPTPEEAHQMGIDEGVVVLCVRKISIDTTDTVAEVSDILMSADRTLLSYTTHLNRWDQ